MSFQFFLQIALSESKTLFYSSAVNRFGMFCQTNGEDCGFLQGQVSGGRDVGSESSSDMENEVSIQ